MNCERLVVFGDSKNDIDMFLLADEGYAVQNANDDLKKYATAIITSNDNDGVAKWLEHNYNCVNSDVYERNEKFHEVDKNTCLCTEFQNIILKTILTNGLQLQM
ncbi:MAG: HAD family hydrolase [Muribaculaceae bacterium]|nr:HAD family hydrolase [Alistipes senegalensis]MCM1473961.1 HAD family hydrolase [Muribaculaceae bacterium]